MAKLHLAANLTPNLLNLEVHNVPETCEFSVVVPTLKTVEIRRFSPPDHDSRAINDMLAAATELETFRSFRLIVKEGLSFASNDLKSIELHQSEVLSGISLWAPNLEELNLRGCYSIKNVHILKSHILAEKLPAGHQPTTIRVNTANANIISTAIQPYIYSGRCLIEDSIPDEHPLTHGSEPKWQFLTKHQDENKNRPCKCKEECICALLSLIEGWQLWDAKTLP